MQEITVRYLISDEYMKRLEEITEKYKKIGFDTTKEKMFDSIMCMGSTHDIDAKFKFHEWKLGLREDFK